MYKKVVSVDEENVSYEIEALFTNVPIDVTIDYIIDEIYEEVLKPLCKKLIFKRLLKRLTSGGTFSANGKLMRQIHGCPVGGEFSRFMWTMALADGKKRTLMSLGGFKRFSPHFEFYY